MEILQKFQHNKTWASRYFTGEYILTHILGCTSQRIMHHHLKSKMQKARGRQPPSLRPHLPCTCRSNFELNIPIRLNFTAIQPDLSSIHYLPIVDQGVAFRLSHQVLLCVSLIDVSIHSLPHSQTDSVTGG